MPVLRKSDLLLLWIAVNICALLIVFIQAHYLRQGEALFLNERISMVEKYGLTDLCFFTDAQYTRNPALADFSTPFQDHPLSMEHFPSGSIMPPPPHLKGHEPGKI